MIRAKKSLGQNFLIDREVLEKITNVVQIKDKTILEVGPGTGNLTSFILKKNPKKMFVIEKDNDLAEKLNVNFGDQLTVINDDILNINENFYLMIKLLYLVICHIISQLKFCLNGLLILVQIFGLKVLH